MRRATATVVVGVALLALSGCSLVVEPPPRPSGEEAVRQYETLLEPSWRSTGLSGLLDRPTVTPAAPIPLDRWQAAIGACMQAKALDVPTYGVDLEDGFQITQDSDSNVRLNFYICLAENPAVGVPGDAILTRAQLDYIYDYYMSWAVPCLTNHGYLVVGAVTREEFVAGNGEWSPYDSIRVRDVSDFERADEECGPRRPPLD